MKSGAINHQEKIIALWIVFLLGILFHTQLGLMPLFHGINVAYANPHAATTNVAPIFWLMLGFFVIPMVTIVITAFTDSKRFRTIHFGITVFYSVLNFLHIVFDLMVTPIAWYQIALMVVLFLVGLVLNVVAFQWMRAWSNDKNHRMLVAHGE